LGNFLLTEGRSNRSGLDFLIAWSFSVSRNGPMVNLNSLSGDHFRTALALDLSRAAKIKTHQHIVNVASKRFREKGLAGIGIADLMKEVGLTVGGFYKHFDSRETIWWPKQSPLRWDAGSAGWLPLQHAARRSATKR
jgi:hypothetical protein